MRNEVRFVLAIALMLGVLILTNLLFPPIVPDPPPTDGVQDSMAAFPEVDTGGGVLPEEDTAVVLPEALTGGEEEPAAAVDSAGAEVPGDEAAPVRGRERTITVTTPLYRIVFTNQGARIRSVRLSQYESFTHEGAAELVVDPDRGMLGRRLAVAGDTVNLSGFTYEMDATGDIELAEGSEPRTLTFRYDHPQGRFFSEVRYTFHPDFYLIDVDGSVPALERAALFVDLGPGLALNEVDEAGEMRMMTYGGNLAQGGITNESLAGVDEPDIMEGPLLWAATKTKFFLAAVLPGTATTPGETLSGIWVEPVSEDRASVEVGAPIQSSGRYGFRAYLGPIERDRLIAAGDNLEEVNPYGWSFLRTIIRPFVGIILWTLNFLHDQLLVGYGWVLIIFAVVMRILLWPLNQKAMRAQLRNMAVQPLLQEIQTKYKNEPEKLQKEMMKLYKEHGFNPFAGCLPLLIPYPVLIALFFVFQNTIELRGQSFLWLPDLSAPDPLYLLPLFLGLSMFLLQYISFKSMDKANPQMKMMMWMMPIMMMFIFFRFASGLNLYYAMVNVATLPQQYWIAKEREKARAQGPVKKS